MKRKYTYNNITLPEELLRDPRLQGLGPQVLTILCKRGLRTWEDIRSFITSDMKAVLSDDPMLGMDQAVDILREAVRNRQRIVVYRDYDCDGCCAGAIALECLTYLDAVVEQFANRRGGDGYGMCAAGVEHILQTWPDTAVILTVDNGIAAFEGIRAARKAGLRVVVTDHHEASANLPPADAIVDPKQPGEASPYRLFCGAGVVFKLMLALFRSLERDTGPVLDTLDLVALATVADVVPLTGENRTMVREGLKLINSRQRPFFRALMEETGMTDITAQRGLGFSFAPMVNSVSRLDRDTDEVVRMMISRDLDWIRPRVASLVELNNERKALSEREGQRLLKGIQDVGQTCILVRDDTLHEGIIGILAGKLREEFNRPAVVFTRNDQGLLKGSARSVDAFPLKQSLDRIPPGILLGYGGHTLAAGLSLLPENFDAFSRSFTALTDAALAGSDFLEWQEIDLVIQEEECTRDLLFSLHILEPFGAGCPAPVFGLRALPVSVTYMGKEQQHVKYLTASGLQVIQWGQGDAARNRSGFPRKFVGFPSLNVWRNTASVQFICQ